ncbi:hypothetical protein N7481_002820 [Penicillium waksmanii]|uniref:uncharacterized protein n=1 Tax=Penicillium waksmanii TaxID=69791 RepID=UPI002548DB95|nr:uncharacterized protein N7481_002820 [Penicillium waksmanii]KAJ5995843.1 hypothetical protein N7481_002820 [Penicillium waksmanii]
MARLNDYAAPAESVDALKRRFVRQNREIMRVNSMQSMRIRSLESEVSHLLSENVSLRGQIITLTQENERLGSAKALQNGVYEIKARLDAKLAELNGLVSDLGTLPRKAGKMFKDKSFDTNSDRLKTAEAPPRANDPDYNAETEDGKLPAILEDKYFPRKTLEPQEVHDLMEGNSCMSEAPQMDYLDPATATEDTTSRPDETPSGNKFNLSPSSEAYLPPTLETRKKKRRPEVAAASSDNDVESGHTVTATSISEASAGTSSKFGSKRKFSLDDDALFDLAPEDDFQFSRLNRSPQKQKDTFQFLARETSISPSKTPVSMKQGSANNSTTKRKVLEPKSANSHLGSPKKSRAASQLDNKTRPNIGQDENLPSPQKPKDVASQKSKTPSGRPRGRPPSLLQKPKRANQTMTTEDATPNQTKTKTTIVNVSKDSPIAKSRESMEDMSDETGASRPSRRRGAVVSYAEPSLRAKMRRSTKDMADAVADRRSSSFQLGRESLDGDDQFVERKPELGTEDSSRTPSSGRGYHADAILPDILSKDGDGGSEDMIATVSRRRRKVSTANTNKKDDIFDTSDNAREPEPEPVYSQRQSRRHSSNPKSSYINVDVDESWSSQADSSFDNDDLNGNGWKLPPAIDAGRRETRIGARRRSMMV